MAARDNVDGIRERPGDDRDEHVDARDAPSRDRVPGGHRGEHGVSRGVEVDSDRRNVVEGVEFDGISL